MIDPAKCAVEIVKNDPDLAVPLLDLLIWAANTPDLKDNNEYDEIVESLYARTDHSRKARAAYADNRAA